METIKSNSTLSDTPIIVTTVNDNNQNSNVIGELNNNNSNVILENEKLNSKFELLKFQRSHLNNDNNKQLDVSLQASNPINITKNTPNSHSLSNSPNSLLENNSNNPSDTEDGVYQRPSKLAPLHINDNIVNENVEQPQRGRFLTSAVPTGRSHSPTLKSSLKTVYFNTAQNQSLTGPQQNYKNSNNNSISSTSSLRASKVIFIDRNESPNKQILDGATGNPNSQNRIVHRFEIESSPEETNRFEVEPDNNYKDSVVLLNTPKEESSSSDEEKQENQPEKPKSKKAFKIRHEEEDGIIQLEINNDCLSQLSSFGFYQALLAEMLGTFFLVLFVCGFGLPVSDPTHQDSPASINGCLGSGLIVATLAWCLGHVSGANLNPAVTIALFFTGELNLVRAVLYIGVQMLGATLGAYTLREMSPEHIKTFQTLLVHNPASRVARQVAVGQTTTLKTVVEVLQNKTIEVSPIPIGVTSLHPDLTDSQGVGIEIIVTFILMMAIFACLDSKRKDLHGSFPLTIGLAVTIGALFAGPFTGGSMNPARSFGPALIMNSWDKHWIYWVGPITGAIIAGIVYKTLVYKAKPRSLKHRKPNI